MPLPKPELPSKAAAPPPQPSGPAAQQGAAAKKADPEEAGGIQDTGDREAAPFLLLDPAPGESAALSPEGAATLQSLAAALLENPVPPVRAGQNPSTAKTKSGGGTAATAAENEGNPDPLSLSFLADRLNASWRTAVPAEDGETEALDLLADHPADRQNIPPPAAFQQETADAAEGLETAEIPPPPDEFPAVSPALKAPLPAKPAAAFARNRTARIPAKPEAPGDPDVAEDFEIQSVTPAAEPPAVFISPVLPPPVSAAATELENAVKPDAPPDFRVQEAGLLAGGVLLLITGMVCACAVAGGWLALNPVFYDEQGNLPFSLMLWVSAIAGTVAGLALGWGCLLRRRWAPPLLAAAGRSVLTASLTALAGMALHSVLMFTNPAFAGTVSAPSSGLLIAGGAALGVWMVAALALALGESEGAGSVCRTADPRSRWTDRASPGALSLFTSSLLLATVFLAATGYWTSRSSHENPAPESDPLFYFCAGAGLPLLAALCVLLKRPFAAWWLMFLFAVAVVTWNVPRLPAPSLPLFAEAISWAVALFLFPAVILFLSRGVLSRRR